MASHFGAHSMGFLRIMVFTIKQQRYKIMDNRIQPVHEVGICSMGKVWNKENLVSSLLIQSRLVLDNELLEITALGQPASPQLHKLLDRFSHLFAKPMLLPHRRSHDHQNPIITE